METLAWVLLLGAVLLIGSKYFKLRASHNKLEDRIEDLEEGLQRTGGRGIRQSISMSIDIEDPGEDDICAALSMMVGREGPSFITLYGGKDTWMQADDTNVQYKEGSVADLYRCPLGSVSYNEISNILVSYARGDDFWRTAAEWVRDATYESGS